MIKKVDNKWCLFSKDGKKKLFCHKSKKRVERQEQLVKNVFTKENQMKQLRTLKLKMGAEIRTATFENREHLVAPVVAIKEGVIFPVNAESPELVLSEELSKAPEGWNGRPVVLNHPRTEAGERVSANDPKVLEQNSFGMMFNTKFEDKSLKTEAWFDIGKAQKIGATGIIEKIRNNEMVEVSVGVYVQTEKKEGEHNGEKYSSIWKGIVPDHLAILTNTKGACSNDMGCGVPRNAEKEERIKKIYDFITFKNNQDEELSDVDVRRMLNDALRAVEPGYMGVEAIFDKEVVYWVMPEDRDILYRRSFSMDDDEVKLMEDRVEVKPVTRFEPAQQKEKDNMSKVCEKIKQLIASEETPWEEKDEEYLSSLPEEKLDAIANPPVKEVPAKLPETDEEWLKVMPEALSKIITEHRATSEKERGELIKSLSEHYEENEIKDLETELLKKMFANLPKEEPKEAEKKSVNFGGKGTPKPEEDNVVPEPPSVVKLLQDRKKAS
jgi:hypothetical protein